MNPRISSLGSRINHTMRIEKVITIAFIKPVAILLPVGVVVGISDGICVGVLVGVCVGICVGESEKYWLKMIHLKLLDNN